MTPLAARIANEATMPLTKRTFRGAHWSTLISKAPEFRCFEVTAVLGLSKELADRLCAAGQERPVSGLLFLPFPYTVLEFCMNGGRQCVVLEQRGADRAFVYVVIDDLQTLANGDPGFCSGFVGILGLGDNDRCSLNSSFEPLFGANAGAVLYHVMALLSVVNSPKTIGRRSHMPHAGLQRRLARAMSMPGKYPLKAWTEILLEVRPRVTEDCEQATYLTGMRALHHVRQHIRVFLDGSWTTVRDHWRGDAALGMVQSRYKVEDNGPPQRPARVPSELNPMALLADRTAAER